MSWNGFEPWPHPHGHISDNPTYLGGQHNFGVIPIQKSSRDRYGEWEILLLDPCPTTDMSKRLPSCTIPDNKQPMVICHMGHTYQTLK